MGTDTTRDLQRLPRTIFPLVLRKEYFDCPQRNSPAVFYITFNREGGDESVRYRTLYFLGCSKVAQLLLYNANFPFVMSAGIALVDWNCTVYNYPMYTVTLYNFSWLSKKIFWDLATVTSCIDVSVKIVTKSPNVGPLLIFSISMDKTTTEKQKKIARWHAPYTVKKILVNKKFPW